MSSSPGNRRLKYAVEGCFNGVWGDEPNGTDDLVVVRVADFDREKARVSLGDNPTVRAIPLSARNRRVLNRGDLLIEKSGGGEQQPVGNVVLFDEDVSAVCSNFVARLPVASDCDARFVAYTFRALYAQGKNIPHIKQTSGIQNLDSETYLNELAWQPPLPEQRCIANFLDEQTARIDALIAGKESLLAALSELRLSRINEAVSLGLGKDAAKVVTKDDWFPEVPKHWAFCPLNYRYEVQLGKMLDEKRIKGDSLLPYLRNTDVQWNRINVEALPSMDISEDEYARYTVRTGDLLVCEGGEVGRAAIWDGPDCRFGYQKALHRVRPRSSQDHPRFLFYALFDSAQRGRFEGREKATIAHLTAEAFRRYRFAFPPFEEQTNIAGHLDELMKRLDMLGSHCTEHIDRLREYRSSLISAAVTGQLDISTIKVAA